MSRKDYVRMAAMIAGEYAMARHLAGCTDRTVATDASIILVRELDNITRSLADILKQDNSRFDRQRFYDAAGSGLIA
jgi:hypothetical protein